MMNDNPKISIITVCLNSEKKIKDNIISVNNQEYKNIEQIFVDGLSSDKTIDVISKNITSPYKLLSESDGGIYSAMNKGIRMASGDYIIFLNSDDVFAGKGVIARYIEVIRNKRPGIVFSNVSFTRQNDMNLIIRVWKARSFRKGNLKYGWMPPHPSVLVKREIFDTLGGFDEGFRISGDYEFLLRIFKGYEGAICYLDMTSVLMRSGGISNSGYRNALKKWHEDLIALRKNKVGSFLTVFLKRLIKVGQFS